MLDGPLVARFDLKGNKDLALAQVEKDSVRQDLGDSFELSWLEDRLKEDLGLWGRESRHVHHFALETVLWIGVGMAFSAFLKPFAESVAGEAGKDFWIGLKRLAGRIWKAQSKNQYRYKNTVNVVFNDRPNSPIVVQFRSPFIESDTEDVNDLVQARLDAIFASLNANILKLQDLIEREQASPGGSKDERQRAILVHLSEDRLQVSSLSSIAEIGGKDIFSVKAQNSAPAADG